MKSKIIPSSRLSAEANKKVALPHFEERAREKQGVLSQGAEATISLTSENQILKHRIKKSYRIKELDDKIRKLRTRNEAKLIELASKKINVPKIIESDEKTRKIKMEFINGKKLSTNLDKFQLKEQKQICKQIGKNIFELHSLGIIHGDLTTSNMIYVPTSVSTKKLEQPSTKFIKDSSPLVSPKATELSGAPCRKTGAEQSFLIYFIDFGLAFRSEKPEDRAVDLHLLRQALEAKHFKNWKGLFQQVLQNYKDKKVLEQLKKVESRGRYKH